MTTETTGNITVKVEDGAIVMDVGLTIARMTPLQAVELASALLGKAKTAQQQPAMERAIRLQRSAASPIPPRWAQ